MRIGQFLRGWLVVADARSAPRLFEGLLDPVGLGHSPAEGAGAVLAYAADQGAPSALATGALGFLGGTWHCVLLGSASRESKKDALSHVGYHKQWLSTPCAGYRLSVPSEGLADAALKAGVRLRAAIYSRVSKDARGDQRSIEGQDDENEAACADNDWSVEGRYSDNDKSASRFGRKIRQDWDRLFADLQAMNYDVLVLWESSRGDRRLSHWVDLLDLCRDLGTLIHITSHGATYDMRKRRDYKTLASEGLDSADDSEKTSERVKRDKRTNALKGRPNGAHLYGYRRIYELDEKGRRRIAEIVFDEERRTTKAQGGGLVEYSHAGIVRDIFDRLAAGDGIRQISRDLNRQGVPPPRGAKTGWTDIRITDIGSNAGYVGRVVHRGQVLEGVEAMWPALVSAQVFHAVSARLNDPNRKGSRDTSIKHLLSGLALCGVCGSTVRRVRTTDGKGDAYACVPGSSARKSFCVKRRIADVDAYVQMSIWERLVREDIADLIAEDARADERLAKLEAEVAELEDRLDKARASFKRGRLSVGSFEDVDADLSGQITRLRQRMTQGRIGPILRGMIRPTVEEIEAEWWSRSLPARREVIRSLTEKVEILPLGARKKYAAEESVRITWMQPRSNV